MNPIKQIVMNIGKGSWLCLFGIGIAVQSPYSMVPMVLGSASLAWSITSATKKKEDGGTSSIISPSDVTGRILHELANNPKQGNPFWGDAAIADRLATYSLIAAPFVSQESQMYPEIPSQPQQNTLDSTLHSSLHTSAGMQLHNQREEKQMDFPEELEEEFEQELESPASSSAPKTTESLATYFRA